MVDDRTGGWSPPGSPGAVAVERRRGALRRQRHLWEVVARRDLPIPMTVAPGCLSDLTELSLPAQELAPADDVLRPLALWLEEIPGAQVHVRWLARDHPGGGLLVDAVGPLAGQAWHQVVVSLPLPAADGSGLGPQPRRTSLPELRARLTPLALPRREAGTPDDVDADQLIDQPAGDQAADADAAMTAAPSLRCRVCGCTEQDRAACEERSGVRWGWAEPGLCLACAGAPAVAR